jgi:hypothetical protein
MMQPTAPKGTDLATVETGELLPTASGTPILVEDIVSALKDPGVSLTWLEDDGEAASRAVVNEILAAADPLNRPEVFNGEEIEGQPFTISAVDWRPSDMAGDGGRGFFAVIHAAKLTAEGSVPIIVTCGGVNVMTQLVSIVRGGTTADLSRPVVIELAEPTRANRRPLWLRYAKPEEVKRAQTSTVVAEGEEPF